MKKSCHLFLIIFCASFISCSSIEPKQSKLDTTDNMFGNELMEFIGFKNLSSTVSLPLLDKVGAVLEKGNIAVDRSKFWLGIYSFAELELYKSTKRYISFVQVNKFYINTYSPQKPDLAMAGALLTGFMLLPIGIPMIAAAMPNKTIISFDVEFVINVYDAQKKEIALSRAFVYQVKDIYKGRKEKTPPETWAVIDEYYRVELTNALWKEYIAVDNFLRNTDGNSPGQHDEPSW